MMRIQSAYQIIERGAEWKPWSVDRYYIFFKNCNVTDPFNDRKCNDQFFSTIARYVSLVCITQYCKHSLAHVCFCVK